MLQIKKISVLLLTIVFIGCCSNIFASGDEDKYVVVLDAGHGGKDSGARGSISMEKEIVLEVTRQVGEYLNKHMKKVDVIYTRNDDTFLKLYERANIANEKEADLFVSIHANASPSKNSRGTETFVMGLHKTDGNLAVAQKENSVVALEEDYSEQYEGYDPHSPESYIIFSLMTNAHLDQSLKAAELVQKEFRERARRKDRGVKQAGFLVLWKTTMPSILIEIGFISNRQEETYLNSDQGKDYIASAIFRAIRAYFEDLEANEAEDVEYDSENKPEDVNQASEVINDIVFKVQLTASSKKSDVNKSPFDNLGGSVEIQKIGKFYKYYLGNTKTYQEAKELQNQCREAFPDSFIVAFEGENPLSLQKAIDLTK
ncbi:MAG: N-acetylmuramoyl-L-alanine amidase [Salinivirgaceae bacterium]|nr:MAG: N-acetylmuramoyl-L-alanine amidase [Salinivirgaceae bacterium]